MGKMEDNGYIWMIDRRVLEYIRFHEFSWLEIGLIVVGLAALVLYGVFAYYVDRRTRHRERKKADRRKLSDWLGPMSLSQEEYNLLKGLTETNNWRGLYQLLSDAREFEVVLHKAISQDPALSALGEKVRETRRFKSNNLNIPVVSTRQFVNGDVFLLAVPEGSEENHLFAWVEKVTSEYFTLQFSDEDFKNVKKHQDKVESNYLRGMEIEHPFPWEVMGEDREHNLLLMRHTLTPTDRNPRKIRLPFGHNINVTIHGSLSPENLEDSNGNGTQGVTKSAQLLDLSDGGFSLLYENEIWKGHYITMHLSRTGGHGLPLTGKVLESRPFKDGKWLVRCEMKGVTPAKQSHLSLLLSREIERRYSRHRENLPGPKHVVKRD